MILQWNNFSKSKTTLGVRVPFDMSSFEGKIYMAQEPYEWAKKQRVRKGYHLSIATMQSSTDVRPYCPSEYLINGGEDV